MASVYEWQTGETITEGLQGCTVCDEAVQSARRIAARRGEPVLLSDDDGEWLVEPSGDCTLGTVGRDGVWRPVE